MRGNGSLGWKPENRAVAPVERAAQLSAPRRIFLQRAVSYLRTYVHSKPFYDPPRSPSALESHVVLPVLAF